MSVVPAIAQGAKVAALVRTVEDSVTSPNTKRAYRRALEDFLTWYGTNGRLGFQKATVQEYKEALLKEGKSPANVNQRLAAIRKLATEAAENKALDDRLAAGIRHIKGIPQRGEHRGNWLTKRQAELLLGAPDTSSLLGLRDRAMLAILLGCALRRQELAGLTFEQIQQRDGRWVIVDLIGKGNRIRTVPMPAWAKALIDRWAERAGLHTGRVLRPLNKAAELAGDGMTDSGIYKALKRYTEPLGMAEIAPHDLRRSFAKLALKGGAPMHQIQLTLGHSSIQTTERYLGVDQELADAPCDRLGLTVEL